MKAFNFMKITALSAVCFAVSEVQAQMSIAVFPCLNETGGQVTSIAGGEYKEKIVPVGSTYRQEEFTEDGKLVKADEYRTIYDTQVARTVKYEDGGMKIPDSAISYATGYMQSQLSHVQGIKLLNRLPGEAEQATGKRRGVDRLVNDSPPSFWNALKNAGAQYALFSSITDFQVLQTASSAYGVALRQAYSRVAVRLTLVDTTDSHIIASSSTEGEQRFNLPDGMVMNQHLFDYKPPLKQAIDAAVREIADELCARNNAPSLSAESAEPVCNVTIYSTPSGADVNFRGAYIGTTPCQVELPVVGGEIIIATSQSEWRRNIQPKEGMEINATLTTRLAPQKKKKTSKSKR